VASPSAAVAGERPFDDRHADAYDALISDPVEPWVAVVDESLQSAGLSNAKLLDAGCGTGRHAAALIQRGHDVTLLDASSALLRIARKRCPDAPAVVSDLCAPALTGPFDAVIARGVLNDLLTGPGESRCPGSHCRTYARRWCPGARRSGEREVAATRGRDMAHYGG
jgi:SAM-dependent methyltransferase